MMNPDSHPAVETMNTVMVLAWRRLVRMSAGLALANVLAAQEAPRFTAAQALTNREFVLTVSTPVRSNHRLETSTDLSAWTPLATVLGAATAQQYTDSATPWLGARYYRLLQLLETNLLTGDHFSTTSGELVIHPINHATFVISWNGKMIYADPVGGSTRFTGLPRADLILVTHGHSDHFDSATLTAVKGSNTIILAPQAVYSSLSTTLKAITTVLTNKATTEVLGLRVDAVPAYNLSNSNHPKGVGNGYVLTIGGKRIYLSGDTEDIPELRALRDIDAAFVCMNVPYTMSVTQAASAVREARPRIVYLYHYSGYSTTQVNQFKSLVGNDLGIEVRLRKWY